MLSYSECGMVNIIPDRVEPANLRELIRNGVIEK
jgi:hypothetical protein